MLVLVGAVVVILSFLESHFIPFFHQMPIKNYSIWSFIFVRRGLNQKKTNNSFASIIEFHICCKIASKINSVAQKFRQPRVFVTL